MDEHRAWRLIDRGADKRTWGRASVDTVEGIVALLVGAVLIYAFALILAAIAGPGVFNLVYDLILGRITGGK